MSRGAVENLRKSREFAVDPGVSGMWTWRGEAAEKLRKT